MPPFHSELSHVKVGPLTLLSFLSPLGIAGTIATLGYGAYAYRFRGAMSTSRYLMRLRVFAQTAIVGSMIVGVLLTSMNTAKKD